MRGQEERVAFVGDRYEIIERLGEGGMGRVYLAHDARLDRRVALKVLREDLARGEEFVSRFRREAQAAAGLSQENVVRIFDTGFGDDGVPYISMEYVAGGTLADRLKRKGSLPPGEAARIAAEIACALQAAHEGGLVHRDIKPHNVFLTERGAVKVGDFGIALAAGATALTQASLVFGTARYISPEVARGEPATPRSDLYSLGVVLYEMLTGSPPFEADNPIATAMRHVTEHAVPPKVLVPSVPEALDDATMRLLAKDPAERPASALAAADEIEGAEYPTRPGVLRTTAAAPGRPAEAGRTRPGGLPARSRRRTLLAGALCALLAAVALPTALPALVQPGEGGPFARLLSSLGDAGPGSGGAGAVPRLASPLGDPAAAAPKPPMAPETGRSFAADPAPQGASPSPSAGEGEAPASWGQYQYEPEEAPQYAPPAPRAGPKSDPAQQPEPPQEQPPRPAPSPSPEPEAEQPEPVPPPQPVDPENTPPPLGPDGATEGLADPVPNVGPAPEDEADEIVDSVQERVEDQVQDVAPGFSFDEEEPRERVR